MQLRAQEKLQVRSLAAKLSYQAWRGIEAVLGLQGRKEQNQGWLLLTGSNNALCQGSRARGGPDRSECRITVIMLNRLSAIFAQIGPLPTPKTSVPLCCYNTPVQECLSS